MGANKPSGNTDVKALAASNIEVSRVRVASVDAYKLDGSSQSAVDDAAGQPVPAVEAG